MVDGQKKLAVSKLLFVFHLYCSFAGRRVRRVQKEFSRNFNVQLYHFNIISLYIIYEAVYYRIDC